MIKTVKKICPKCGQANAVNEKEGQIQPPWKRCSFCFQDSDTKDWK